MGMAAILVICDPDHLNNFSFLKALEAWNLATISPEVSEEKSFEIVDGRTEDGRTTEPAYHLTNCYKNLSHSYANFHRHFMNLTSRILHMSYKKSTDFTNGSKKGDLES